MEIVRIGDKVISKTRIYDDIERILQLRSAGMSQQDVAREMDLERSFISRLEGLGEIRKGGRIAVIGFPIKNIQELQELLQLRGVEYSVLLTEEERWRYIKAKTGLELFNQLMAVLQDLRSFDKVILLGSRQRIKMMAALLDKEVLTLELGESPLQEDVYVEPERIAQLLDYCQKREALK